MLTRIVIFVNFLLFYPEILCFFVDHGIILVVHFLNTVLQQIVMHAIRHKKYKKHNDQRKKNYLRAYDKGYDGYDCAYRHQAEYYKMHKSFMHEKAYLLEMLLYLTIPVSVILLQDIIYIAEIT